MQPVKLLAQREDYSTCHIATPDADRCLAAIALDGIFYRFFCVQKEPAVILNLLQATAAQGQLVAMTSIPRGYAIWIYEPAAALSSPQRQASRSLPSSFGSAHCWIIGDRQSGFRDCTLDVPDLPQPVPGIANRQKLFSLHCRESDAQTTLQLGASLSQRGDELVISLREDTYAIYLYEPGATIA